MDQDEVEVHKNAKRERGQYPAILTELRSLVNNGFLFGIKNTYFGALKRKPVLRKRDGAFRFSRGLVPSRQRNNRKCLYCHGKYLRKKTFVHSFGREQNRKSRAGSIVPSCPRGQPITASAGFSSSCPLTELVI